MNFVDRQLQQIRIRQAAAYISPGAELLDIGCADGEIFRYFEAKLSRGIGIDPDLCAPVERGNIKLLPGQFPGDFASVSLGQFDVITLLAVLEHIPPENQKSLAQACANHLKPGGLIIITVPGKRVDAILDILAKLKIIDGMSLDEHYGFDHAQVPVLFEQIKDIKLILHKTFELGMNNLFIFQKAAAPSHGPDRNS